MSIVFTPTSPIVWTDSIVSSDPVYLTDSIVSTVSPLTPFTPIITTVPTGPLTLSFNYSKPLIGVYETIDTNPEVRKKMLDYYYDLIRDDWLLNELNDVLNYFTYKDGKVSMIKNISEYSPNNIVKDTDAIANKKVEFLEKFFTEYDLLKILEKFTKETYTKFVDLPRQEFFLKQSIKEYIIRDIKKRMKEQKGGGCGDLAFF